MLALFHIGPASCREEGLLGGVADTVEASGQSTGSDLAEQTSFGPCMFQGGFIG